MVTGACWSDVDHDGWADLLVTYEWGPIRCFKNQQGRELVEATSEAGLAELLGWWNGIAGGDVDHDGDIDFVVTNFGLNTKYHASPAHPARIYYGDYDGSGKKRIVEAEFEGEKLFPVRGKSCSTTAIPILGDRFKTYSDFGIAELSQVYTEHCLQQAEKFEINTLETGVLLNDGRGHFQFRALPRIAQIAPSFGASLLDVNLDGNLDVYLAQNFYSAQRETGHMDGGVSQLLLGRGDGTWQPVWPNQSGIVVGADAVGSLATDLNQDGLVDLLVAVNAGKVHGFEATQVAREKGVLHLRLHGPPGNPTGIGARLKVTSPNGHSDIRELHSTAGYLTQCSSDSVFVLESASGAVSVEVTWPGGKTTNSTFNLNGKPSQWLSISFRNEDVASTR